MNAILVGVMLFAPVPQDQGTPAKAVAETIDKKIQSMVGDIRAAEMEKTVRRLVGFGTRQVLSATDKPYGTGAARNYLQKRLESFIPLSDGRLTVKRETYEMPARRLRQTVKLVNIVAALKGVSDPGRVYVVGGHYDSINSNGRDAKGLAPGANDDGSGTSVVIEACRVMCSVPFAATIKFVCYDGEEQGLLGSEGHAKALADAEVNVDGMITNDIVGNTLGMDGKRRRGYLRCFSYSPSGNDSTGRNLARVGTFATRRYVGGFELRLIYRGDRYGRGGDHKSFNKRGFPSIRFTEPREDFSRQHKNVTERDGKPYGDLPEFMDFEYMIKVAAVNVALLAQLASAPPAPVSARARGARSAYDTNLSWSEVKGAKQYEVVWRQTTSPDWERSRLVEEPRKSRGGLSYTMKGVCLDDVVVGVRSVAADGSRSRVRTPPEPDAVNQRRVRRNR